MEARPMYAVIKTGGKQYKVSPGDVIEIDKYDIKEGENFSLKDVMFLKDDTGKVLVGSPIVQGYIVKGELLGNVKGKKVIAFKFKRKKHSQKKRGFKSIKTKVKITDISKEV